MGNTIRNRALIKSALSQLTVDELKVVSKKGTGRDKIIARRLLREIEPAPRDKIERREFQGLLRQILGLKKNVQVDIRKYHSRQTQLESSNSQDTQHE